MPRVVARWQEAGESYRVSEFPLLVLLVAHCLSECPEESVAERSGILVATVGKSVRRKVPIEMWVLLSPLACSPLASALLSAVEVPPILVAQLVLEEAPTRMRPRKVP